MFSSVFLHHTNILSHIEITIIVGSFEEMYYPVQYCPIMFINNFYCYEFIIWN